jgi:hypothetical protein
MVRPAGLEPATLDLEGRCSIQMSYGRLNLVGVEGFEPPTSCSQSKRATSLRYTPYSLDHQKSGDGIEEPNECQAPKNGGGGGN